MIEDLGFLGCEAMSMEWRFPKSRGTVLYSFFQGERTPEVFLDFLSWYLKTWNKITNLGPYKYAMYVLKWDLTNMEQEC